MMVDTATPADRDKSYKNMKCPETVTTSNNYDLATVRTAYEDISEEDDDEDISRLESTSVKRKSPACGSQFSNPLRVETADSSLLSCLSAVSGPSSAPSAVCWASPSPSSLSFLSPAASLSPGLLLPSPQYYPPVPLASPALTIYQSSTPARPWKHPFSISSLLGREEEEEESGYDSYHHHHHHHSHHHSHHITADSASLASHLDSNEDSYIDVVGLDEEEEEDNVKAKECNDDSEYKCSMKLLEPDQNSENANDRIAPPMTLNNSVPQAVSEEVPQVPGEDCVSVFDIKKKMLDNWSKSRKDMSAESESEYQHKKIRKASHEKHGFKDLEPSKVISNDETEEKLKKKRFLLENYEVKTNINKNKRKEEKWSNSETDSPDKYKDQQKVKKKHKSHKEERWKISKNLKSPIRHIPEVSQSPKCGSCTLTESDLVDGLRLLLRVGSHFYAGRLTEISPPDIYGVLVDRERGNKPHIFTRQEIIRDAIVEIRPESVSELELGRRICVYWSSQLSYLHPSTVVGPDHDDDYILVQLDDGDSRDVHIDQVRYLPQNYPVVDSALGAASELEFFGGRKGQDYLNDIRKEKMKARRSKKKVETSAWSVVVTEVGPGLDCPKLERREAESQMEDDQDSAFESDTETSVKGGKKTMVGITSFLPPQHRLWRWEDEGRKLSAKSRRVYHNTISRAEEKISVGDCAVFLSTGRPDTPYIGRIHSMWQTAVGNMRVQVKWFYHPAEVEASVLGDTMDNITLEHALFSSGHSDENDVQTISHKCLVLRSESSQAPGDSEDNSDHDVYNLVGDYDPLLQQVTLLPPFQQ